MTTLRTDLSRGTRRHLPGVLLVLLGLLWFGIAEELAARAATGFAANLWAGMLVPLLRAVFLLFLVALGLALLEGGRTPGPAWLTRGLPKRATAKVEWASGVAVGWGAAVLAVLPLVLSRRLELSFWTEPRAWLTAALIVAGAALTTLASEVVYRAYGLRRLQESVGQTWAVLLISLAYAIAVGLRLGTQRSAALAFLFSMLLSSAWVRTQAIWLSWGVHFAWNVSLGVLFGLPVFETGDLSSVVQAQVSGRSHWLGGRLGPIGGWWTALVLLLAIVVLVRITREFAWLYTHPPIVAAGYPMDVKPPAAHAAIEQAPAPPPLVQILPATPSAPPPPRVVPRPSSDPE